MFKNYIKNNWKGENKSKYNLITINKSKILVKRDNN